MDQEPLNEALDKLATRDAVKAELVKPRHFVGLTTKEAAKLLEISPRTARNYVREAVRTLESGEKVKVSQTKSYGCGVKYGT